MMTAARTTNNARNKSDAFNSAPPIVLHHPAATSVPPPRPAHPGGLASRALRRAGAPFLEARNSRLDLREITPAPLHRMMME